MRNYESEAAALRGLKPSSKVLALVLAARMNDRVDDWPGRPVCWPSLDALQEDTDLKERMVRYALDELIEAKVIRVYKDRAPGSRWDHNVYEWTAPISPCYRPYWMKRADKQQSSVGARLTSEGWEYCEKNHLGPHATAADHPEFVLPAERPALIDNLDADAAAYTSVTEPPVEEKEGDMLPINTAPPKKPARKDTDKPADGFDEWWKQYPKKVSKLDAKKAYRAVIKQGATPQDLLDGLQRHNANWKANNTEPQYIPHPASWLRKGRWEDELSTPASNQATPAISPTTGKAATKEDFWYACKDHGIDPRPYVNFWKPSMGLPGDPGWPEQQTYLDRHTGRA
jgi:putative uncharacterized protein 15